MVKYKIYYVYQGVVAIRYFRTPREAMEYRERVANQLDVTEISNIIETP